MEMNEIKQRMKQSRNTITNKNQQFFYYIKFSQLRKEGEETQVKKNIRIKQRKIRIQSQNILIKREELREIRKEGIKQKTFNQYLKVDIFEQYSHILSNIQIKSKRVQQILREMDGSTENKSEKSSSSLKIQQSQSSSPVNLDSQENKKENKVQDILIMRTEDEKNNELKQQKQQNNNSDDNEFIEDGINVLSNQQFLLQSEQSLNQYHRLHKNKFNYTLNRRSHSQSREQDLEESASSSQFSKSSIKRQMHDNQNLNVNNCNQMSSSNNNYNININNNSSSIVASSNVTQNSNSDNNSSNSNININNNNNNNFLLNIGNKIQNEHLSSNSNAGLKQKAIKQKMFNQSLLNCFVKQISHNDSSKSSKNNSNMSSNDSNDNNSGANSRVIIEKKNKDSKQHTTNKILYGPTKEELNQKLMDPVGHRRAISSNIHHQKHNSSSGSSISSTQTIGQKQPTQKPIIIGATQIINQLNSTRQTTNIKQESSTYSHFQAPIYSKKMLNFNESSSSSSSAESQQTSFQYTGKKKSFLPFSSVDQGSFNLNKLSGSGDINMSGDIIPKDDIINFEKSNSDMMPSSINPQFPSFQFQKGQSHQMSNRLPTVVTEGNEDDEITSAFQEWSVNISPQATKLIHQSSLNQNSLSPEFKVEKKDNNRSQFQEIYNEKILLQTDKFDEIYGEIDQTQQQTNFDFIEIKNGEKLINLLEKPSNQQQFNLHNNQMQELGIDKNIYQQQLNPSIFYDSFQQTQAMKQQDPDSLKLNQPYAENYIIHQIVLQQQQQSQIQAQQLQLQQQQDISLQIIQQDQQNNLYFTQNENIVSQQLANSLILPPQNDVNNNLINSPSVVNQSLYVQTPPSNNISNNSKVIQNKKQYHIGDLTPRDVFNTLSTNPSSKKSVCMKSPKEDNFFTQSNASSTNKIINRTMNIQSALQTEESLIENFNQQYPTVSSSELGMKQKNQCFISQAPIPGQSNLNPALYNSQAFLSDEQISYQQQLLINPGQKMKTQPNPSTSSSQLNSNNNLNYNFLPTNQVFKTQIEKVPVFNNNPQNGLRSSECQPQSPPNQDFVCQRKSLHVSGSTGSHYFSDQKHIPQQINMHFNQMQQQSQMLFASQNHISSSNEAPGFINQQQYSSGINLKTAESADYCNQQSHYQNIQPQLITSQSLNIQQISPQQQLIQSNNQNQKIIFNNYQLHENISQAPSLQSSSSSFQPQQHKKTIQNQMNQNIEQTHSQIVQQSLPQTNFQPNRQQQLINKKNLEQIIQNYSNFPNSSGNSSNSGGSFSSNTGNINNLITNNCINSMNQQYYQNNHKRQQSHTIQGCQKQNQNQIQQIYLQKNQQKYQQKQNNQQQQLNQSNLKNFQHDNQNKQGNNNSNNFMSNQQQNSKNINFSSQNNNSSFINSNKTYNKNNNNDIINNNQSDQQKQSGRHRHTVSDSSTEFRIDLSKINEDGRTTLMIKNIPNKYVQDKLLETINKRHSNTYDFFYLPIDFTVKHKQKSQINNCNVGYAFINFNETRFIEPFYKEFNDQKWKKYNSDKVYIFCNYPSICQLFYARIQGSENLNNHFKTSQVMNLKVNQLIFEHLYNFKNNKIKGRQIQTIIYRQKRQDSNLVNC